MGQERANPLPPVVAQVGAAIRRRRNAIGMGLKELAKQSDLSIGYLSLMEQGKHSPSLPTLCRICEALDITIVQVFSLATAQIQIAEIENDAMTKEPDPPV